jgi:hypothetical protein
MISVGKKALLKRLYQLGRRATRCIFEKVAQNAAQSIFCQNYYISVTAEKVAQLFGLLRQKLPKENSHPMGEKSPNLVTLLGSSLMTRDFSMCVKNDDVITGFLHFC